MIEIKNINESLPYDVFLMHYQKAILMKQESVDAISISSLNKDLNEVESRYVNLKYIINDSWIFFTNYDSLKSKNFFSHNQISCLFFWNKLNVQVRMKAKVKKCSIKISDNHFQSRPNAKNALAISSNQSSVIKDYDEVVRNYNRVLKNQNALSKRPKNWGGYSFTPYYFEFWEGHESRINKRNVYKKDRNSWKHFILQP